ncbi:rhodanese-like domain-containing protein [Pontiellaceae bacterium B12227]|nr:rhodanese-like domain-containing protein [Pontiellaceae bacterium B12227]
MGFWSDLFTGGASKADLPQMIKDGALLIDARTPQEFAGGHINGAVNLPHNVICGHIEKHSRNKDDSIVIYCQSGARSLMAVRALQKAGYTQVENGGSIGMLSRQLER